MSRLNFRISTIGIVLFFGIIYCLISLVNHYNFRTSAYDLGIYTNALFDYRYGRANDNPLFEPAYINLLSDHFELLLVLFSPLSFIFGSYTLLIVQIAGILLGGLGIYKLVTYQSKNQILGNISLIQFYSIFGIYSALSFDYHNNVMGAMAVPWIFYFAERKKVIPFFLSFLFLLVSKENMALWGGFISFGLFMIHFKDKKWRFLTLLCALFSFFYFVSLIKWIMPSLANAGREYNHFNFHILGNNMGEVVRHVIFHPIKTIELLFINHSNDSLYDGIKLEFWLSVLFSGGILLILRPVYIFMLLPIIGQKMFNDDMGKWGVNVHYSIEIVPILAIAAFTHPIFTKNISSEFFGIKNFFHAFYQKISTKLIITIGVLITVLTMITTIQLIRERVSKWYFPPNSTFFREEHYQMAKQGDKIMNRNRFNELIEKIPDNAAVSASGEFISRLSLRDKIYFFPYVRDAEYLLITIREHDYYLLPFPEVKKTFDDIQKSPDWKLLDKENDTYFYQKIKRPN